mmetsp:Transcript_2186/g.3062  ORF Transcript_2186/g.3062 Transcript_2186/m.3062 type:complete len:478 (-) Transcript_2186:175-1608(-)
MTEDFSIHSELAEKACEFLTSSTDPFHAVENSTAQLRAAGFVRLRKREPFNGKLVPGGKYYYTVNHSTLVAFAVGSKFEAGKGGFKIIGGHTDSPNLKVKPMNVKSKQHGFVQLGVECYGGGLWHTWFDRDLGLSGRVLIRNKDTNKVQQRLVKVEDPVARVSTLCIHLQSAEDRKGFAVNKETHTSPIIGTKTLLEKGAEEQIGGGTNWDKGQEPALMKIIASKLDVSIDDIAEFELNLYDVQPAALGGIKKEFLYSARLDNLATVFCATEALIAHATSDKFQEDTDISLITMFDHEEIGSQSHHGAGSPVMADAVRRILSALTDHPNMLNPDLHSACTRRSFVLSVDMAHSIHPNYASKHEPMHAPVMNGGVVIKANSNQRYTTNCVTGFIVREIARLANLPIQEFVVKNDCPCGSTIGPIISERVGIRTVDIGMSQLSMHSCREVMGIADLTYCLELFKGYFANFRSIDDQLEG